MLNFHEISTATKYQLRKLGISVQDVRQSADYEGVRHEYMAKQYISQATSERLDKMTTNYVCAECDTEHEHIPSWGYCDGSLACSWDDSTLVWVGEGTDPRTEQD